MAGILDFIDQKLGTRLGLLMSDPRAAIEQMNQQAGAYNQASLLATQAERNALRGLPVTPEQAAAKQYVDKSLEDVAMGFAGTTSPKYGLMHRPMTVEGGAARLHEASKAFGEDVYGKNALNYFGSGLIGEQTSLNILRKVRGNPNAEITIYRGVPKGVKDINVGDWVTLDPKMAAEYGNVISKKVKVSDITTWPDSLVEFGYYPSK